MARLFIVCIISAIGFTASNFIPVFSSASFAFPLSLAYTALVSYFLFSLLKKQNRKNLNVTKKLLEYIPFVFFAVFIIRRAGPSDGTFILDLLSVLLWIINTVCTAIILFRMQEKRLDSFFPQIEEVSAKKKNLFMHGVEWIDALVQAACLVLLINLFFFQLYAIPSESMVPEFMIGDRVVVLKTPSGPKFPLSSVGIPQLRHYQRGDIVVFNNPHYNDTKEARVRSFVSQLVYMLSFTTLNINTDEFGQIKADPLVKRIVGVPGEKLMLVDGVLYSRTIGEKDYSVVSDDERYAMWNLDAMPRSDKELVKSIVLSKEEYAILESVESLRARVTPDNARAEALLIVENFRRLKTTADTVTEAPLLFDKNQFELYSLFKANDEITRTLLTTNGGYVWFKNFMTSVYEDSERNNLYDERSRNMNMLLKNTFGKLIVRNAQLIAQNATSSDFSNDAQRRQILMEADTFRFYMDAHDQRNMGEFPSGENEYIPENSYLMVGDNRFNSLDMRHSYDVKIVKIDQGDPFSFTYRSKLSPQYVSAQRILGTASFRFWPLSRLGIPE